MVFNFIFNRKHSLNLLLAILIIIGFINILTRVYIYFNIKNFGENEQTYFFGDYRAYYFATKNFIEKNNPYNFEGFVYHPFFLLIFIPFSFFPFKVSAILFTILNVSILFLMTNKLIKILDLKVNNLFLFFLLLFLYPIRTSIIFGQINIILLFFIVNFYDLYYIKKKKIGVLYLFLSIIMKIWPIFYIFFIIKRKDIKSLVLLLIFLLTSSLILWNNIINWIEILRKKNIQWNLCNLRIKINYPRDLIRENNSFVKFFNCLGLPYYLLLILIGYFIYIIFNTRKDLLIFFYSTTLPFILIPVIWPHYLSFFVPYILWILFKNKDLFLKRLVYIILLITQTRTFIYYLIYKLKTTSLYFFIQLFTPTTIILILIIFSQIYIWKKEFKNQL